MLGHLDKRANGQPYWHAPDPRDSFDIPKGITAYPYFWKDWPEDTRMYDDPLDEFIRSPSLIPDHELIWHWDGASNPKKPGEEWDDKTILANINSEPNRDLRRTEYQNQARLKALAGKDFVNDDEIKAATLNLHISIVEQEIERTRSILNEGMVPDPKRRFDKVPISPDERHKLQNSLASNIRLYHELTGDLKKGGVGGSASASVNILVNSVDELMQKHGNALPVAEVKELPEPSMQRSEIIDALDAKQGETVDAELVEQHATRK